MRINLCVDTVLGGHSLCRLFVNGGLAGKLVLRNEEIAAAVLALETNDMRGLVMQITRPTPDPRGDERD